TVIRAGARLIRRLEIDGPYVATLEPGTRGVPGDVVIPAPIDTGPPPAPVPPDPVVTRVTTPDAAELDLAEATRILAVGAGLGEEGFVRLAAAVADRLGMSLGATRVVTDRGWLPSERQIGTTGAMVAPAVYVALAISGAVQHTNGLGEPEHVVSVNTDGSCPMAAMADVNLVADARGVLIGLAERLGVTVDAELRSAIDGR
ncbi:MAG: FAD-binding protein, partial [Acidimicrobiales bacterium]